MRRHAVSILAWLWPALALACPAAPLPVQLTADVGDGDALLFHPRGWAPGDAGAQAPGCGPGFSRRPARRCGA